MKDFRKLITLVAATVIALCLFVTGIVISGFRDDGHASDSSKITVKAAVKSETQAATLSAARASEVSAVSTDIPVAEDDETLGFTAKKTSLKAGKSYTFKVNMSGVTWTSSKEEVATVSASGKVVAKTVGKTKITASAGTQSVSVTLTVKPKKTIGIDAGHQRRANLGMEPVGPGSSTSKYKVTGGTSGRTTGIAEYKLTLRVAKKLKEELKSRGYAVVMTRTKHDVDISNKERALKLNKSCDIAIRLHADGSDSTSIKGASVLYPGPDNPYVANLSAKSKKLSQKVLDSYIAATGLSSRGLHVRNDLTGTNWSTIPVTLIEMGYMTNASDDVYMSKKANQYKMAKGMADGIDAYFGY